MQGTYVKIDLDNLESNIKEITNKYNDYDYYIGVVKSDAYGHGKYIVNTLIDSGINYLAVSYLDEAIKIREYNKNIPVLCLQPINLDDLDLAVKNNITIIVHDLSYLNKLLKKDISKKLKIHIKIDSGMNRLGLKDKNEVKKVFDKINDNKYLVLEGIFTHFATTGIFDKHYDNQVSKFIELTSLIDLKSIPIIHLGSSVILLTHPKLDFVTGIRMGILMYGYNVSPTKSNKGIKNILRNMRTTYYKKRYNISDTYYNVKLDLKPSMSMKTYINQIKEVNIGEYIGYGAEYKAEENIKIAVIPIGYSNGIGKINNNRYVLINNKKYYVVGSIGMNMMCVKIDESIKINDEVTILGGGITLGMISRFNNSSISETLVNIGNNNKRIYIKNKKIEYIEESR